ncbi:hypothetical protein [Saccharomonospora sp. CUA-673]|uniref:hypothetical protein n=1 Tax=Saccharomonospora sp. CUA-673 TaxID=1904969 RepID=UPI0011152C6D|nr:hypothetical protein [Saccharomonospora sp. CUA-673]
MSTLVAALVAVGVVVPVYFFCLRPMTRGHCGMMGSRQDVELDREIAGLSEELRILRAQGSQDRAEKPTNRSTPPFDA